jgi:hypothetical protein
LLAAIACIPVRDELLAQVGRDDRIRSERIDELVGFEDAVEGITGEVEFMLLGPFIVALLVDSGHTDEGAQSAKARCDRRARPARRMTMRRSMRTSMCEFGSANLGA